MSSLNLQYRWECLCAHCLFAHLAAPLHSHLEEQGVEYMQFAFRWMNCLLMRELSVRNIVRMWDTYLVRIDGWHDRADQS